MADDFEKVEKAKIIVQEGDLKDQTIEVMYNPTEYSEKLELKGSIEDMKIQFNTVNMKEFPVSLFFDTYETGTDVTEITKKITQLILPTVGKEDIKRPPICRFEWGGFGYEGIISKIDQKFTMFNKKGYPVRCELNITFNSVLIKEMEAKLNKIKEGGGKVWTVKSGDRLDLIANEALNDPNQWRNIAEANMITNPLTFPTPDDIGKVLIIPS